MTILSVSASDRKKMLSSKHLCFNCTGEKHRASDCRSRIQCYNCKRRHHTSICDKLEDGQKLMCQPNGSDVAYPVVVVEIEGVKCRALLDTGSGSSFASSTLLNTIGKKHGRTGRGGGRGGSPPSLLGKQSQSGNIRFTVGQYWLIIKINGTNSVNFVGNSVHFVGNMLSNRNFS
jgi:hypothetical protein